MHPFPIVTHTHSQELIDCYSMREALVCILFLCRVCERVCVTEVPYAGACAQARDITRVDATFGTRTRQEGDPTHRGPTQRGGPHRGPTTGGDGHTGDPHRTHTDTKLLCKPDPLHTPIHRSSSTATRCARRRRLSSR